MSRSERYDKHGNRMARLNVWIDAEVLETADVLAELTHRSTSKLVELSLRRMFNQTQGVVAMAHKRIKEKKHWVWHTIPNDPAVGGSFYGTEVDLKREIARNCHPSVKTYYVEDRSAEGSADE